MPQAGSKALARLEKSRAGKSVEEIATEENVKPETVERSLSQANSQELLAARTQIERENNQLRRRLQRELSDKFVAGVGKFLDGEKEVALVVDGEVVSCLQEREN
jgi:IS30 family transposase